MENIKQELKERFTLDTMESLMLACDYLTDNGYDFTQATDIIDDVVIQ